MGERLDGADVKYMGRNGENLEHRIAVLEDTVTAITGDVLNVKKDVLKVKDDTSEILAILTATRTGLGYAKKYGPRVITFGAGLATAAGMGNPKVTQFLSVFFG